MKIRKRSLSSGWYPESEKEMIQQLDLFARSYPPVESRNAVSCIVPHAGWFFSGKLAWYSISHLVQDVDTVVVIGGHLPKGAGTLIGEEDFWSMPGGELVVDQNLRSCLGERIKLNDDYFDDNTVEIQMPLVHSLFRDVRVLGLRVSPDDSAIELGQVLADLQAENQIKIAVIGSTDFTHYGSGYQFEPKGQGAQARSWVKDQNDAGLIQLLLDYQAGDACHYGQKNHAACSVGAAVAAMVFAEKSGASRSELLDYYTSYDVHAARDFVGYSGLIYKV